MTEVPTKLLALARDLAADRSRWEGAVKDDWSERWYSPLGREDDFEAWLLGWPTDRAITLHDHGQSSGAFVVLQGVLLETYLDRGRPNRSRRLRQRRWKTGDGTSFGSDHVHDVVNVRPEPAISLHVYSPRLTSMTFYGVACTSGGVVPIGAMVTDAVVPA